MAISSIVAATLAYGGVTMTARSFGSITVANGDTCAVILRGGQGALSTQTTPAVSKASGTATISSITIPQSVFTTTACMHTLAVFTVTGAGTLVVTVTPNGGSGGTQPWDAHLIVATGTTGGVTNTVAVAAGSTKVASVTAAAGSDVFVSLADWNAHATNAITWTPSGQVEDIGQTDGVTHQASAGAEYAAIGGHWVAVAGGTVNYGITAPTMTTINVIAWEFPGTVAVRPPQIRTIRQAANRASTF